MASIIFAASRCSDLPDLVHVRNLFAAKYGREFIAAASELRPDTSVNRTVNLLYLLSLTKILDVFCRFPFLNFICIF